jgi:hypothetical protein
VRQGSQSGLPPTVDADKTGTAPGEPQRSWSAVPDGTTLSQAERLPSADDLPGPPIGDRSTADVAEQRLQLRESDCPLIGEPGHGHHVPTGESRAGVSPSAPELRRLAFDFFFFFFFFFIYFSFCLFFFFIHFSFFSLLISLSTLTPTAEAVEGSGLGELPADLAVTNDSWGVPSFPKGCR